MAVYMAFSIGIVNGILNWHYDGIMNGILTARLGLLSNKELTRIRDHFGDEVNNSYGPM